MTPRVSIIIPLFNKAAYIGETIASVLAQSMPDFELLVVDNNSSDDGPRIVRAVPDSRVRLLSRAQRGASAARNAGLDAARGEWIVFIDADDSMRPDYLREQLAAIEQTPGANVAICAYEEFLDGAAEKTKIKTAPEGDALLDSAIVFAPGPTHLFLIRRSLLANIRWPENLDALLGEDAYFWFVVLNEAKTIARTPQPLARYRFLAPGSRFTTLSHAAAKLEGLHAAISENIRWLASRGRGVTAGQAEYLMRFYGEVYLEAQGEKNGEIARRALCEAQRWLAYHLEKNKYARWPMRLRGWLGLPAFSRIFGKI